MATAVTVAMVLQEDVVVMVDNAGSVFGTLEEDRKKTAGAGANVAPPAGSMRRRIASIEAQDEDEKFALEAEENLKAELGKAERQREDLQKELRHVKEQNAELLADAEQGRFVCATFLGLGLV